MPGWMSGSRTSRHANPWRIPVGSGSPHKDLSRRTEGLEHTDRVTPQPGKILVEMCYLPVNTGARFSTNARAASAWSAVSRHRNIPNASASSASDRLPSSATFRLRLM